MKKVQHKWFDFRWPGHRIGGEWFSIIPESEEKKSYNPSQKTQQLASVHISKSVVLQAVDAAFQGKGKLLKTSFEQRIDYLKRLNGMIGDSKDQIISSMNVEIGKPSWEAQVDFAAARRYLDWVCKNKDKVYQRLLSSITNHNVSSKVSLSPVGVVAAYFSFSSPITTFVSYMSSILFSGCPVVLFVPTQNTLFGSIIARFDERIKFPKGTYNVVFGDFEYFRHATLDKRVSAVIFAGSKEHCEKIERISPKNDNRKLILQSGGKNSVIVHSSASIELAVKGVVLGAVKSAGQLCSSTSRVLVAKDCLVPFKDKLVRALQGLSIGPTDVSHNGVSDPIMGPLYSEKSLEKFLRFQTMAQREAKETLIWGGVIEDRNLGGFFVRPGLHYLEKMDQKSAYQSNVLFSPDIALYVFDDLDEAIEASNTTESSLCVSFYGDKSVVEKRFHMFSTPNLLVNLPTVEIEAHLPLAPKHRCVQHNSQGVGVALDLCYPQVLVINSEQEKMIAKWPAVI